MAALQFNEISGFYSSLPPHPDQYRTGALPLRSDPRDWSILLLPGVAQALHAGAPDTVADLSEGKIGGVYDQGAEGACVAYSEAGVVSLDQALSGQPWIWLDAENLYRRNGGTGSNGVDTRQTLEDIKEHGINRKDGGTPIEIDSYLFVPKNNLFKDTIMAALSVGHPLVLATLLPENFGWTSSGSPTQGYHQLMVTGGDPTWCIGVNSWGPSWGNQGRWRLPWSYLDPNRWDVFAYLVNPKGGVTPTPPPPPPVPTVTVTGTATGSGVNTLATGQDLQLGSGDVRLHVTQVSGNTPTPPPPPPPGALKVSIQVKRVGPYLDVWAWANDEKGAFVTGTATGEAGSALLPPRSCSQVPGVWQVPGVATGATVQVTVTGNDGRTGTGAVAAP